MTNITLSAQEEAIAQARKVAVRNGTTLNTLFREWLTGLSDQTIRDQQAQLDELWQRTGYVRAGRKFSRQEMNER